MSVSAEPFSLHKDSELENLPLFCGMERDLLQGMSASARMVQHAKGVVFLRQGQPITRFYVILEGWCGAVKNNAEGQESILQIFCRGDFLPDVENTHALKTSPQNLQALTPVCLAMLSPSLVINALEHSKVLAANMFAASIRHCRDLRNHIEQLTLRNAEQRVGRFLLDMRLMNEGGGSDIALPFDKALIAAYLGIKPETLSRTLQSLKDKGFTVNRNHVHMPDDQALCGFCDLETAGKCSAAKTSDCPDHAQRDTAR